MQLTNGEIRLTDTRYEVVLDTGEVLDIYAVPTAGLRVWVQDKQITEAPRTPYYHVAQQVIDGVIARLNLRLFQCYEQDGRCVFSFWSGFFHPTLGVQASYNTLVDTHHLTEAVVPFLVEEIVRGYAEIVPN